MDRDTTVIMFAVLIFCLAVVMQIVAIKTGSTKSYKKAEYKMLIERLGKLEGKLKVIIGNPDNLTDEYINDLQLLLIEIDSTRRRVKHLLRR